MSDLVVLDCKVKSSLDWRTEALQARQFIQQGHTIQWKLDLGLFQGLQNLSQTMQFEALLLALEHFRDTLWKEFQAHTEGIILYEGPADLSCNFPWDDVQLSNYRKWLGDRDSTLYLKSLYCTQAASEYLGLLVLRLPDGMPLLVKLDATDIKNSFLRLQLLNPENYPRLKMEVRGGGYGIYSQGVPQEIKKAVLLPITNKIESILNEMDHANIYYKVIPETDLITEWDGLDLIYYDSKILSSTGKRKLQGFCAAGGEIVDLSRL